MSNADPISEITNCRNLTIARMRPGGRSSSSIALVSGVVAGQFSDLLESELVIHVAKEKIGILDG